MTLEQKNKIVKNIQNGKEGEDMTPKKKLKPIFSYNSDIAKTAYLNWRTNHSDDSCNTRTRFLNYADRILELSGQSS